MISILRLHKILGLNLGNGLFVRKESITSSSNLSISDLYEGDFTEYKSNYKVEYVLKKINPHSFFLFNNEPLLIFFNMTSNCLNEEKQLSKDIWNFNKPALAFVNYPKELKIYNGFNYEKSGLLKVLDIIKTETDLKKLNNYSYWKIVTAELWNEKDKDFKSKTRVDARLLENIKVTREVLTDSKLLENPLTEKHANRIIGRLIFVRYLIDRQVNLDYNGEGKEYLTKEKLPELIIHKENLFNFFNYLLWKFKGDILPLNGEYNAVHSEHLQVLSNLFAGNNIKTKQLSLFNVYDFEFIPIELISNIYETFIGEKQDTEKAFYTPPFLVDYILDQTVKPFIAIQNTSSKLSCKTVDFTCGSGIFLCETLRTLINRYIQLDKPDKSSPKFKEKIKRLLKENIFGNDINQEAIEIAKFSLFITLLDYFENPKDIEDFEFPSISDNFYNYDVFNHNLDKDFGQDKLIEPDFIIGNPPWGKVKNSRYLEYCEEREKTETKRDENQINNLNLPTEIKISNKEFAQAFLLRLSDFSTSNTICQVIVTSKLLYNLQAKNFRQYFLSRFLISEVLEISSVRHQIFTNAVGPAAIIKYKYSFLEDTKKNIIDYVSLKPNPFFSIFKTILIEKYDFKEIIQNELIENDWLWKTLVYGHILDYRFIKNLRNTTKYPLNLDKLINDVDNKQLYSSVGIKVNKKNRINDARHLIGLYFIDTDTTQNKRESDLQRYFVKYSNNSKWVKEVAAEVRKENLFKSPPALLIKIGISKDFKIVSSIAHISCVFTNSIYAVKSINDDLRILEIVNGIINSKLMTYYMVMCGSSIGVEREQLINKELFPFPFELNKKVSPMVRNILSITRLIHIHKNRSFPDNNKLAEYEKLLRDSEDQLDELIYKLYDLSEYEKDLISYTHEITIPILQAKNKTYRGISKDPVLFKPYQKTSTNDIKAYIKIFKKHFNKFHKGGKSGYLNVRILHSKNILAIEFFIDNVQHETHWIGEEDNLKILDLLATFGFQNISNKIFIQKDIKTLKRDSFSIVKINQYKYWHKAIAHLDVIELSEAILQSQIQTVNAEN